MPLCRPCIDPGTAMIGSAILGGLFGSQGGGNTTVTQQTIPTRPTLSPEEEALRNYYINMVYGNVGGGMGYPGSQISNWLYGAPMGQAQGTGLPWGTATGLPTTGADLRQQYEAPVLQARAAKADEAKVLAILNKWKKYPTDTRPDMKGQTLWELEQVGISKADAQSYLDGYIKNPQLITEHIRANYVPTTTQAAQAAPQGTTPTPTMVTPQLPGQTTQDALQGLPGASGQPTGATGIPAGSPVAQIMGQGPESITGQYDILRQQLQKQMDDWYGQALREVEHRATSQGGGYLSSRHQADMDIINAKRQEMLTQGLQQLALAQQQEINQLPYQQLSTLEPIRQWEANYGLSAQQPWINVGQQIIGAPWGQQATSQQSLPGVGMIPGAIAGLGTGANIYALGQNAGWWGQPATMAGMGLSGMSPASSYASSPLAGSGLQGVWNAYMPAF